MIQQRPDLRLQRLRAMVTNLKAVTPAQKATAEATFGEIPASSGGRDFFQTPEVTDLGKREPDFQAWAASRNIDPTQGHYDYRGAFNAGVEPNADGHWPDTFKQHGHETFSNESQYSERPGEGGSWQGEKYIPAGPRVMAAKEMPTTKPGGGAGSYAKQFAVGAAGGLARFVPFVAGQTARDLARTGKAAMALAKAAGSGAAPPDALDQALKGATEEYGGGGQLPGIEPIAARPRHLTGGNQPQAGGGAGPAVGSIFERGMDAANQGITSAEDFVAGKPDFTGQMGRELGEQVGGLLPLLPSGMRAGGSMVDRVLTAAGRKRPPLSTLQQARDLMAPPEPQPIESHAQPAPPVEPVSTTPLRTLADVQKDLAGARAAALEAGRRGLPTLSQEYQSHANKLMAEAKRMASQVEGGVPPEPPAAGQAVLKTPPERRSPQSAATPELGLYNRGAPPVLPAATRPKAEPVPPKPAQPQGLQGMDLDELEKEFVKLDNMPRRNPAQDVRHKVLEAELDRRDQALPPVEMPSLLTGVKHAKTGQPFSSTLFRGEGGTRSPYTTEAGVNVPIFGEGKYTTPSREHAAEFGPNVTEHEVSLKKPLVLENDEQWRALTQRAGWEFANPLSMDPAKNAANLPALTQKLRAQVRKEGYDGVVIRMDPRGDMAKTMRVLFDEDQVIEFGKGKEPTKPAKLVGVPVKPRTDGGGMLQTGKLPAPYDALDELTGRYKAAATRAELEQLRADITATRGTQGTQAIYSELSVLQGKVTRKLKTLPPDEPPPAGPSGSAPKKPTPVPPDVARDAGYLEGEINRGGVSQKAAEGYAFVDGELVPVTDEVLEKVRHRAEHEIGRWTRKLEELKTVPDDTPPSAALGERFFGSDARSHSKPTIKAELERHIRELHGEVARFERQRARVVEPGDAYEPEPTAAPSGTQPDAQALPGTAQINPKFKKLNNAQLLARRHEVFDRMDEMNKKATESRIFWTREDLNAPVHANIRSGSKITAEGGRAAGRAKDDARIISEIDIELQARGIPYQKITEAYDAHTTAKNQAIEAEKNKPITWPDGTVFSFPGPIKASTAAGAVIGAAAAVDGPIKTEKPQTLEDKINLGIVGAIVGALGAKLGRRVVRAIRVGMMTDTQWVADELIKHSNMSDAELKQLGTHMEGILADAKKAGIKQEDFDAIEAKWRDAIELLGEKPAPPEKATVVLPKDIWKFPDEKGAAHAGTVGALAGAGVGAVLGAAASEKENKVGGALTGALAGAYAGHILTRAAAARGAKSVFQQTVNDPDVAAVLSAAAQPRKGPLRTFAGLKAAIVEHARSSYQAMLDDVYAARRFGREVGKTEKVSDEASRARGWRGFGDELIGRTERWKQKISIFTNLPTLRKAVQASKGHEAEVIALSWAERAIELEDAGMDWKLYGHATRQQAEATVRKLSAIPEARKGADQLRAFYDYLYELRYKNGLIGKAEYLATKAKHQQYVSFLRDFGNEQGINAGSAGGKLYMRGSTVKKMEAGIASSPIVDPFEQAAADAYRVARAVSRQRVFNAISEIVAKDPAGAAPWIKDFGIGTKGVPRGYEGRTIQARVNGELHLYGIENYDFFNALSAITPESHDIAHYLLTLPKKTLQAGTTIVPSFGAANASRDAFFTSLAYDFPVRAALAGAAAGGTVGALADKEHPLQGAEKGAGLGLGVGMMAVHGARIAKAFGHIVKNDDIYQIWKRGGGSGTGMFVATKQDAEKAVAALRHDHVTPYDLINPKTWWDALENFNRMVEEAPRLAMFEHWTYKKGQPVASGIAKGRGVSLDFSRHGGSDIARLGRETSAFWNPKLQGLDKMREVFAQPKTYAMGIATMTAPTVALWMINKDDPEYQKRPLYEKMLVWHIPVGKDERGVTQYFLLPKPFEPGYVFASLPQLLLDYAYRRDKERTLAGLSQITSSVGQGLVPWPTAAQPILENQSGPQGWSSFRGRPIVDDALAKLPAREQIDSRTSTVAIALSRAAELGTFGAAQLSPKKIDNVIQGWFGRGGRVATSQIDAILQQSGMSKRPVAPARNTSQWSRFVSQEAGFNTDDIQALFRQYDDASKHLEQAKRLMKEGQEKEAQAYIKEHRVDLITARMYARAIERYRGIARGRRQIENSRSLSADEKRKQIADLGEQASALAKAYVDARLKLVQGAAK